MPGQPSILPLVSVIIPCYNHGRYLAKAIRSVGDQTYKPLEIIVVNDGSVDDTEIVAKQFDEVKYIYQVNQGLSAARNTGIRNSTGEYLVFLDADDWLYKEAIAINYKYLQGDPSIAFVSGSHTKVDDKGNILEEEAKVVQQDHFFHLLKGNYIGMHAAVMYRRNVFDHFTFDTALKAGEDYDLYLKIARRFPILHHTEKIAAYCKHENSMSSNEPMMLDTVLYVLKRHKTDLQTGKERDAYRQGRKIWKDYYLGLIMRKLFDQPNQKQLLKAVWKHGKLLYFRYQARAKSSFLKRALKKYTPSFLLRFMHKGGVYKNFIPSPGKISHGDFYRVTPFSTEFGYDRGGPVDRYYIENFLQQNANLIKGRVLEIGDNEYTLRYGGSKVSGSDILHVDDKNPKATFAGDLSNAPFIPSDSFDTIILTQTLHLVYDYKAALQTCYRILKPGGTLLLTVPGITPIDHGEWKNTWWWSFTANAVKKMTSEIFPRQNTEVQSFGNIYVATAFLYGMGLPEVKKSIMDYKDEHYQVIITAKCTKP